MTIIRTYVSLIVFLILVFSAPIALSETSSQFITYTRLYTDADGVTHFVDEKIAFGEASATGSRVTPFTTATQVGYVYLPVGNEQDWHPAPLRQWIYILSGIGEIEAQDGEIRQLSPGSILFVEDITGKGHKTRVIGDEAVVLAWVPVDPE